jgi:hypothetical protein
MQEKGQKVEQDEARSLQPSLEIGRNRVEATRGLVTVPRATYRLLFAHALPWSPPHITFCSAVSLITNSWRLGTPMRLSLVVGRKAAAARSISGKYQNY